jgi:phage repressor protein C with HTH and peptisase S24 domain
MEVEAEGWVEAPEGLRLTEDMFVAHVTGRSMEPRIPAGSLCVFRGGSALVGSRQGKLVLVMNYGEPGENRFTIKRYRSVKQQTEEGWTHNKIILEPLNPEYESWEIDEDSNVRVIGEFVQVLES